MIQFDFSADNVLTLTPEGALSVEDFGGVRRALDEYVNRTDSVPNVLVHAKGFPHWDSFRALGEHLRIVKDHHKLIAKVAVVGDQPAIAALPFFADHFVAAKVRHFPERQVDAARAWLVAEGDRPGRIVPIEDGLLPRDVIAVQAEGIITARDYRDFLKPLMEERLREHDKLKLLFVLTEDFTSYAPDAMLDDLRFGLGHWADFRRVALVTDVGWIANAARLFGPLMPAEVKVFGLTQLDEAKEWIKW